MEALIEEQWLDVYDLETMDRMDRCEQEHSNELECMAATEYLAAVHDEKGQLQQINALEEWEGQKLQDQNQRVAEWD